MYIKNHVLSEGEEIKFASGKSWSKYLPTLIILWIVAGLLITGTVFAARYRGDNFLYIQLGIGILIIGVTFAYMKFKHTKEYIVTADRVIIKEGIFSIDLFEISHRNIESMDIDQSFLGRIFNYGNVEINGTGNEDKKVNKMSNPMGFRKSVMGN